MEMVSCLFLFCQYFFSTYFDTIHGNFSSKLKAQNCYNIVAWRKMIVTIINEECCILKIQTLVCGLLLRGK